MSDPTPRIPQITEAQRTDEVRAMFDAIAGVGSDDIEHHHVLKTFAQHPALTHVFLDFNKHLLTTTTLPPPLRQLAILRVAWLRHARYMWASHVRMSLQVGLSDSDIETVKTGHAVASWGEVERAVLEATEQLIVRSDVTDSIWESLSAFFDRKQILDLLFTVGAYVCLAMVFNTARIEREPHLVALAEKYGTPE